MACGELRVATTPLVIRCDEDGRECVHGVGGKDLREEHVTYCNEVMAVGSQV